MFDLTGKVCPFFFWSKSHWLSAEETLAIFEIWAQDNWIVEGLGIFQSSKCVSLEEKNSMTTAFCHSIQKTFITIIIICIFYTMKRGWCHEWVPSRLDEFALLALVTDFFLCIQGDDLDLWSFCLQLQSTGVTVLYHHNSFIWCWDWIVGLISKRHVSMNWTTSLASVTD